MSQSQRSYTEGSGNGEPGSRDSSSAGPMFADPGVNMQSITKVVRDAVLAALDERGVTGQLQFPDNLVTRQDLEHTLDGWARKNGIIASSKTSNPV